MMYLLSLVFAAGAGGFIAATSSGTLGLITGVILFVACILTINSVRKQHS